MNFSWKANLFSFNLEPSTAKFWHRTTIDFLYPSKWVMKNVCFCDSPSWQVDLGLLQINLWHDIYHLWCLFLPLVKYQQLLVNSILLLSSSGMIVMLILVLTKDMQNMNKNLSTVIYQSAPICMVLFYVLCSEIFPDSFCSF